jgi:hypothetical protein
MKFNSLKKGGWPTAGVIVALMVSAALVFTAAAQTYFTNSTSASGGYQYNDNLPNPLTPSQILANQYKTGTLAGVITPGAALTVTFATNIFSATPFVVACSSATNYPAAVTAVTTTNFTVSVVTTNSVTIYWEATGH